MVDEFSKYLAWNNKLNEVSLPRLKELVELYPTFQTAWMLLLKNLKILNDPDFEMYLKKGALRVPNRKQLYFFLFDEEEDGLVDDVLNKEYLSAASYHLVSEDHPQDESLSSLMRSIQEKRERKTDDEKPKDSENKFVTETLAKIYAKQGLIKEAIQAYEKLSLKYPEKNTYFAGQIKELKEQNKK